MKPEDWIRIAEEFEAPFTTDGTRKDSTKGGLCDCAELLGHDRREVYFVVFNHTGQIGLLCPRWSQLRDTGKPFPTECDNLRARVAREIAAKLEKYQIL